jgi:hypothetical protein
MVKEIYQLGCDERNHRQGNKGNVDNAITTTGSIDHWKGKLLWTPHNQTDRGQRKWQRNTTKLQQLLAYTLAYLSEDHPN